VSRKRAVRRGRRSLTGFGVTLRCGRERIASDPVAGPRDGLDHGRIAEL